MSAFAVEWLLTWIWQGIAVALLAAAFVKVGTRRNAATRYLVWWTAFVGVGLLAVGPWLWTPSPEPAAPAVMRVDPAPLSTASAKRLDSDSFLPVELPSAPVEVLVTGMVFWAAFSGLRLAALSRSFGRLRRVRQHCTPIPVGLEQRLPLWMSAREEGRRARLCLSDDVTTASMLGLGTPIIALPRSLVRRLDDAELDQVVLHEHGHVQRRDDWAAAAHAGIEALSGWHPAVWWIGRQLRLEREVACDDWVLRRTSSGRDYAACLARVASLTLRSQGIPLGPRAIRSRSEFGSRVERLLDLTRNTEPRPAGSVLVTAAFVLCTSVVLLGSTPPIVTTHTPAGALAARAPILGVGGLMSVAGLNRTIRAAVDDRSQLTTSTAHRPEQISPDPIPLDHRRPLERVELTSTLPVTTAAPRHPIPVDLDLKPALAANLLVLDAAVDVVATPPNTRRVREAIQWNQQDVNTDTARSPWGQVARAGRAIGIGASQAGVATASAFHALGASFTRAFTGRR